ncbi:MAG: hypothetical protein R2809_13340 [Flavobacteriales bacterium]
MKARSMASAVKRNEDGTGFEEFMEGGKAIYPDHHDADGNLIVKSPDSQDQTSMLIGSEPNSPKDGPFQLLVEKKVERV